MAARTGLSKSTIPASRPRGRGFAWSPVSFQRLNRDYRLPGDVRTGRHALAGVNGGIHAYLSLQKGTS